MPSSVQTIVHNFAKQYGVKNKSDTCGHYMKAGVDKIKSESSDDREPQSALEYAQMALAYVNENHPLIETMLEKHRKGELNNEEKRKLKDMLRNKTPYQCTKRCVGYVEGKRDNFWKYQKKLKNICPDLVLAFSDHYRMKAEEDYKPLSDTTEFYSYSHSRQDDNPNSNEFEHQERTQEGKYLCRVCGKEYQRTVKRFEEHERICFKIG